MSSEALNTLFTSYGDTSGRWSGGDSTASVLLPDGRIVWLFSDTLLGTVNPDHSRPKTSPFINNSMVVQEGADLVATLHGGTTAEPDAIVKPATAGEFYWVADGTVEGNALRVLYNRYRRTGSGSLDVALTGTALATFDLPTLTLRGVTELSLGSTVAWGSAILEDGDYTYIYGTAAGEEPFKFAHLARVPAGGLAGPWEFWDGTGWSTSQASSARLLSGVGTAFAVHKVGTEYVLVTQESNLVFEPAFVAYTAPSPSGPFTGPTLLFTAPEQGADERMIIVYDARLHPELTRAGKLLVSYNVNSLDSEDIYVDARIYRPRFVEVDWPRAAPDPATLPPAPEALTATAGADGQVTLSWQPASGTGLKYWLYQRDVTAGQTHFARLSLPVEQTTASAGFLRDGHQYEFRVTAANSVGEGPPSNVATATPNIEPPPSPGNVIATADSQGRVVVAWSAVTGAWNYDVFRRDVTAGQTEFIKVTSPGPDKVSLTVDALEPEHEYEFYVTANHGGGTSAPSNYARATARYAVPPVPTGLIATPGTDGTITLSWNPGGENVWHLIYQRDVTAGETEFTQLPLPVTSGNTLTAQYLVPGHQYEFQISATNRGGESPRSASAYATAQLELPPAPTGLAATPGTDGTITLTWNPGGENVWHLIYVRDVTAQETEFTQLPLPVTSGNTLTAQYLVHGHEYEFKVSATNQAGEGPTSAPVLATAQYAPPPAPTNLRATAGNGDVLLTWDSVGPDVWYLVYQRDLTAGETEFTQLPLPITSGTTVTASYLINAHEYEFKVAATNQGGEGPTSTTVSATPMAAPPSAPTGLTATPNADGTITLTWTAPGPDVWYLVYQRDVTTNGAWQKLPLPVTEGTTLTASMLTHNHRYEFKVAATNATGEGPASTPVQATAHYDPPPAPQNLRGVAAGDGVINLDWDPAGANLYYWVYYRDATAGDPFAKAIYPTDKTEASMGMLRHGHVYEFKITAENAGGEGPASSIVQVTAYGGLPQPPTNLTASAGDGEVDLRWTASPTPGVLYVVYQRDVTAGQSWQKLPLPVSGTQMNARYLTNGHTYAFKVTASNSSGESTVSNVVTARPLPPLPAAPSGLTASPGDGKVTLHWSASSTSNVYYWIEYRASGGSWQRLKYPVSTCCTFTVGSLTNGRTYDFRARATNLAGDSSPSNVASARPLPPLPAAPSGLTASPGDGRVALHWSASPTSNVYYWIEYRASGGSWQRLKYPVSTCCTFTVGYLANGRTYDFRVRATNLAGDSSPSNVASARPMPPFPSAPSGLSASPGDGKVTLRWSASPTSNVYYWIEYRVSGGSWQRLKYPVSTCCTFTVSYLTNGKTYEFRVRATNLAGDSSPSNVASARPMPPVPSAPSGLIARSWVNSAGTPYMQLDWDRSPTSNVYYWVYYRLGQTWQRMKYPIDAAQLVVWYLHEEQVYEFKVTAVNLAGESGPSNVVAQKVKPYKMTVLRALTEANDDSWNNWYSAKVNLGWPWEEYYLDWSDDDCSGPSQKPFHNKFRPACERHDFGYRNYNWFGICRSMKWGIDWMFLKDMYRICGGYSSKTYRSYCANWANNYYMVVSVGGWGSCH